MRELEKKRSVWVSGREITLAKRSTHIWTHGKMGAPELT